MYAAGQRNSSVGLSRLSRRTSCTWKVKLEKHMGEKAEVAAELESDGKEVRKKLSPKIVENAEGDPGWADDTGGKWKGVSLEKNGREGMKSKTYEVGSSLWGSASPGIQGIMKILSWNVPS